MGTQTDVRRSAGAELEDTSSTSPLTVGWGDGDAIPGTPFRQVVSGAETEARVVVIAADMPGKHHVATHTHHDEDQITVVVRGRIGASVGDQQHVIEEGGVVFLPRGVPHALWNLSDDETRLLDIYTPSGIEALFAAGGQITG